MINHPGETTGRVPDLNRLALYGGGGRRECGLGAGRCRGVDWNNAEAEESGAGRNTLAGVEANAAWGGAWPCTWCGGREASWFLVPASQALAAPCVLAFRVAATPCEMATMTALEWRVGGNGRGAGGGASATALSTEAASAAPGALAGGGSDELDCPGLSG